MAPANKKKVFLRLPLISSLADKKGNYVKKLPMRLSREEKFKLGGGGY